MPRSFKLRLARVAIIIAGLSIWFWTQRITQSVSFSQPRTPLLRNHPRPRILSAERMKHKTTDQPQLIAIAAMASNRVIGRDGKLPWQLPEDLKFFKQTTLGHPVLMGRKTFESIMERLGKPLPGRLNIVLSKTMPLRDDVQVIRDISHLQSSISLRGFATHLPFRFAASQPIYLIGGAQLYEALLPQCDELLLTCIDAPYEGDAFFPPFEDVFECQAVLTRGAGWEIRRYVRKATT